MKKLLTLLLLGILVIGTVAYGNDTDGPGKRDKPVSTIIK